LSGVRNNVAGVTPDNSAHRAGRAARTGVIGTLVVGVAFFDAVFVGMPIAVLSAWLGPVVVFAGATVAVTFVAIGCCNWVDRRWDDWFSGNAGRIEKRLEQARSSRLLRHPVAWIERGSDRRYALAAALINPVIAVAIARIISGNPIGERRILLGSIAYAIPYVALWSLAGFAVGDAIRAA
jgi:hypothetical protein